MSCTRSIWLLACVLLAGCGAASEGGVTGTGISAISGNIAVVSDSSAANMLLGARPTMLSTAGAPATRLGAVRQSQNQVTLPFPIRVTIAEFPDVTAMTDDGGAFQLDGEFSGDLTLVFTNAQTGAEIGPLALEIPSGSQTVLENIEIRTNAPVAERVQPRAVRQFDVFGHVDMVECAEDGSGTVLLTDNGRPARQFMVVLDEDTEITSKAGSPLTCADIQVGANLRVEGLLRQRDRVLFAVVVVVSASRPPQPGPSPRPERLRGVVHTVSCGRGTVEVDQRGADPVRRTVRLTDQTEFQCAAELPGGCDCSAIAVGASIAVTGTILPARPGQVRADVVFLQQAAVPVDLLGTIDRVACAAGGFTFDDDASGQGVRVAVTADTEILCAGDVPCGCADLRSRQRARVQGRRPPEGGPVTAERVSVIPRRQ
jgi:hypothetical protein